MGLEDVSQPREHLLLQQGVARLGYADYLHLFGKMSVLKRGWNMVIITLKEAVLEAQPAKSKLWSPSADVRQSQGLPVHPDVDEFAALVERSIGGID